MALDLSIDFMGKRKLAVAFSTLLIVVSIASFFIQQLNFGIDFTGGTLIELGFKEEVNLENARTELQKHDLGAAQVQFFGTAHEVLVRLPPVASEDQANVGATVVQALSGLYPQIDLRRVEFVGPQVGEELTNDGGIALLVALGAILVYVYFRFEYRFALGSVAALIHDIIITLGVFSVMQFEFDLTVLAALLAVIGYSLNDTIVVSDRIRENFRLIRKAEPAEVINRSINQTLSRTLVTSLTTLLVLFALFFFGGDVMMRFSMALIIGIFIGTYSSIYIASTTALALGVSKQDLVPAKKEGDEIDSMP